MLKVKLGEKIFECPDSWDEISLRKFQSIMAIPQPEKKEEELEYKIDILAELLGCFIEDLQQVKLSDLGQLWDKCEWIVTTKPNSKLPELIKLSDGKDYYFDSNLDQSTFGMWVDLEDLMKQDFWQNAHKIASIFVRPVEKVKYNFSKWKGWRKQNYPIKAVQVQEYDPVIADQTAHLLLDAPVTIIYTISVFFWSFSRELLKMNLQNYIHIPEIQKMMQTVDSAILDSLLQEDGDGIQSFGNYQKTT